MPGRRPWDDRQFPALPLYPDIAFKEPFMTVYRAPLDDYRFVLHELLDVQQYRDLPQFTDLSPETIDDILTNAAKFCEDVLHP
jgi:hypothetical protein